MTLTYLENRKKKLNATIKSGMDPSGSFEKKKRKTTSQSADGQESSGVQSAKGQESSGVSKRKRHVLIGCTGSVASVKVPILVQELLKTGNVEVAVIATENALHFFDAAAQLAGGARLYRDTDEWQTWNKIQDPVLHIELRRWADILVVAPLDANTMAKMATGICDNLLTCVVRAWDLQRPLLFCPAMNTHMWDHPITAKHIETLKSYGYQEVKCIEKTLACGDKGFGAMAEVPTIVSAVLEALQKLPAADSGSKDQACSSAEAT